MKRGLLAAAENRVPLPERLHNQHENHGGENGGNRGVKALVENEALRFGNFLGGNFSGGDLRSQGIGVGEKTNAGVRMKDLLVARGHGDYDQPGHGQQRHPNPAQAAHFHQDGGGHDERYRGQQVIRNTEERPERIDPAERINYALIEKVAPQRDDDGAGNQDAGHPAGAAEGFPDAAAELLDHKTADAGSSVEDGENEKRFEHDGEVI